MPVPAPFRAAIVAPLVALLFGACDDGTIDPEIEEGLIAVGLVRLDRSPDQPLSGFLAFFYDPDQRRLLTAEVAIDGIPLDTTIEPQIVPGPIYVRGAEVRAGEGYRLTATVQGPRGAVQIASPDVFVPPEFEIRAAGPHPVGQPLTVTWDPVANVEAFNIVVVGTTFETEAAGNATSVTIPASAFATLGSAEIEVTAYNGFYVSLSAGISSLADAEQVAARFTAAENLTGARGSFGAATTAGIIVTFE